MNIEEIENIAKKIMEESGSHTAQIMLDIGNAYEIMVLCFRDTEEKIKMCKSIRELVNARNISRYFFITEGWISGNPAIMPSDDPNRKEGLIIQEFNRNLKNKAVINVFDRVKGKIRWVKRDFRDTTDSEEFSAWNFFVEDAGSERIQKVRVDYFLKNIDKKKLDKELEMALFEARKKFGNDITKEQLEKAFFKLVGDGVLKKGKGDKYRT
jgi:hypothetical protein